ncbi:MAG TPA: hypothetical protein VF640_02055, partial [Acidimicrobiales bacterium]
MGGQQRVGRVGHAGEGGDDVVVAGADDGQRAGQLLVLAGRVHHAVGRVADAAEQQGHHAPRVVGVGEAEQVAVERGIRRHLGTVRTGEGGE